MTILWKKLLSVCQVYRSQKIRHEHAVLCERRLNTFYLGDQSDFSIRPIDFTEKRLVFEKVTFSPTSVSLSTVQGD